MDDEGARSGGAYWGAYGITKAAVDTLSRILADELECNSHARVLRLDSRAHAHGAPRPRVPRGVAGVRFRAGGEGPGAGLPLRAPRPRPRQRRIRPETAMKEGLPGGSDGAPIRRRESHDAKARDRAGSVPGIDCAWRLALAHALQTTLHPGRRVEIFARHSARVVAHDGVAFTEAEAALEAGSGGRGSGRHDIELRLEERRLGTLTFTRRHPFRSGEIRALEAMSADLARPLDNAPAPPRGAGGRNPGPPDRSGHPRPPRGHARAGGESRAPPRWRPRPAHDRRGPLQGDQ